MQLSRRRLLPALAAGTVGRLVLGAGAAAAAEGGVARLSGRASIAPGRCGIETTRHPPCTVPGGPAGFVTLAFLPITTGATDDGPRVTTDGNGHFTLALPAGDYRISVVKPRHLMVVSPVTVTVAAGQAISLEIMLQALYAGRAQRTADTA